MIILIYVFEISIGYANTWSHIIQGTFPLRFGHIQIVKFNGLGGVI